LEYSALAEVGAACVPHPKANLSSQSAWQHQSSSHITKAVDEVGSSTTAGSTTGDTREPGQENGGCGRSESGQTQSTPDHGLSDTPKALETPAFQACTTSLDTQAREN